MDTHDDLWAGLVREADLHHPILVDSIMDEFGLEAEAMLHEGAGYLPDDDAVPSPSDSIGDGSMIPSADPAADKVPGTGVSDDPYAGSDPGVDQSSVVPSPADQVGATTGAPQDGSQVPPTTAALNAGVVPGLEWLAGDSGASGSVSEDIERMHREATKMFSPAERDQIINEGADQRAGNLGRMDLTGTHYVDEEALW